MELTGTEPPKAILESLNFNSIEARKSNYTTGNYGRGWSAENDAATWAIVGDAEEYRLSEGRQAIRRVLANADEPLSPNEIAEITGAKYGATRDLGRGAYTLPTNLQNNADILTNQEANVSLSGLSGHFRKEGDAPPVTCIHNFPAGKGCYACGPNHPYRLEQEEEG